MREKLKKSYSNIAGISHKNVLYTSIILRELREKPSQLRETRFRVLFRLLLLTIA